MDDDDDDDDGLLLHLADDVDDVDDAADKDEDFICCDKDAWRTSTYLLDRG